MKVYISGKITGQNPEQVRAKFEKAEAQITAAGHDPVSPLKNGLDDKATWEEHMAKDVYMLLGCDAIYLLPDWQESQGARIEENIAQVRGLVVINQPAYAVYEP